MEWMRISRRCLLFSTVVRLSHKWPLFNNTARFNSSYSLVANNKVTFLDFRNNRSILSALFALRKHLKYVTTVTYKKIDSSIFKPPSLNLFLSFCSFFLRWAYLLTLNHLIIVHVIRHWFNFVVPGQNGIRAWKQNFRPKNDDEKWARKIILKFLHSQSLFWKIFFTS